ncbi:hypothetical protein GCM10028806_34040 [Spirosoma terrae]|uniref:Uncharacterized protein n=1 Tax=Spirosoma terrae TaxID=1968276 RepID=A0A6L9L8A6_9BACT|nr:hypothetical protein [Spirosoma terrae]NDU95717.1 hypothetical protein [Spirosoma terrae]
MATNSKHNIKGKRPVVGGQINTVDDLKPFPADHPVIAAKMERVTRIITNMPSQITHLPFPSNKTYGRVYPGREARIQSHPHDLTEEFYYVAVPANRDYSTWAASFFKNWAAVNDYKSAAFVAYSKAMIIRTVHTGKIITTVLEEAPDLDKFETISPFVAPSPQISIKIEEVLAILKQLRGKIL